MQLLHRMSLINVTKSTYKQSLRDYVILTISYLRAQTIETSSLPNDSMRLLFKQIEIFLGILTVLFNCKDFFEYTRELLVVPPRDFASSCGGGNKAISFMTSTEAKSICLFSSHFMTKNVL